MRMTRLGPAPHPQAAAAACRPCATEAPAVVRDVQDGFAISSRSTIGRRYQTILEHIATPAPAAVPYDSVVGQYDICQNEPIARGGMAMTLLARHRPTGSLRVVKIVCPGRPDTGNHAALERELRACQLVRHPNVVQIHDVLEWNGAKALVMSHLGSSAHSVLSFTRPSPMALELALEIGIQTAAALTALHAVGIVHCDVKPGNIMVQRRGDGVHVTLIDLGLCILPEDTSQHRAPAGTAEYGSPEQAMGTTATPLSDIYSLGLSLHHLLEDQYPIRGATSPETWRKQICFPKPELRCWLQNYHAQMNEILQRMTQKNPELRYQSADEVRRALLALQNALDRRQVGPATPKWASCTSPLQLACDAMRDRDSAQKRNLL